MNRLDNNLILNNLVNTDFKKFINEATNQKIKLYLVGGAVRDILLEKTPSDLDIEIHGPSIAKIEHFLKMFAELKINQKFKIYQFKNKQAFKNIQIALAREEIKNGKHRTDFELFFSPTLELTKATKRRDFTINSLYLDLATRELFDPTKKGLKDLKGKIIEVVNKETFLEDELRVIRGICFAARFDFTIGKKFEELIKKVNFDYLSVAKIVGEFKKVEKNGKTVELINLLINYQILDKLGFEFAKMNGLQQNSKYHYEKDCLEHTRQAVNLTKQLNDPILSWGSLFHDYGKIKATTFDGELYHAKNHEEIGYQVLKTKLNRIFENQSRIQSILKITRHHMAIRNIAIRSDNYEQAIDFMRKVGKEDFKRLLAFSKIDLLARQNKDGNIPKIVAKELNNGIIEVYWKIVLLTNNYIEENYALKMLKLNYPNLDYQQLKEKQNLIAKEQFIKIKETYEL